MMGSSDLSLVEKHINNNPIGVRVLRSIFFSLQTKENLVITLEISTILVPRDKEESLGGRSWCL